MDGVEIPLEAAIGYGCPIGRRRHACKHCHFWLKTRQLLWTSGLDTSHHPFCLALHREILTKVIL